MLAGLRSIEWHTTVGKEPLVIEDWRQNDERPKEGELIKETRSKGE